MRAAGGHRAQGRHRRRIQSRLLAPRLPAAVRQCAADPVEDHGALPFRRGHARAGAAVLAGHRQARAAARPIFVDDFRFLASVARATPKITIPSPTDHAFPRRARGDRRRRPIRTWRRSTPISRASTARRSPISRQAGCRYLQIDEVNLAYLCDPALRAQVSNIGEDPDSLPKTYAKLLNDTIAGRPRDMTVCMHLCRGNFAGAWVAEGGYEPVAELLFNEIDVDGYFLEYDSARAGGFEPLRFLPKGKIAVLGLVTTKSAQARIQGRAQAPHRRGGALRAARAARAQPAMRLLERHRRQHHDDRAARSPSCGWSSRPRGRCGGARSLLLVAKKIERRGRCASLPP